MEKKQITQWEVHQGHYIVDEGRLKLASSSLIASLQFDSREEAWDALCVLIETGNYDHNELLIHKPSSKFHEGPYPSFYDITPFSLSKFYAAIDACKAKQKLIPVTNADLWVEGRMKREMHGRKVVVEVVVGYPGSAVTDILIGGHKVQIPNAALRTAAV